MIPANEHHCPVCGYGIIPIWRALCVNCFNASPWKLRADYMQAYRKRVYRNAEWQELLAAIRLWYLSANPSKNKDVT